MIDMSHCSYWGGKFFSNNLMTDGSQPWCFWTGVTSADVEELGPVTWFDGEIPSKKDSEMFSIKLNMAILMGYIMIYYLYMAIYVDILLWYIIYGIYSQGMIYPPYILWMNFEQIAPTGQLIPAEAAKMEQRISF